MLSTVWRVTWRLLLICLVVSALTAAVFTLTKGPIAAGERARKEEAMRLFFPTLAGFEQQTGIVADGVNAVYLVKNEAGEPLGLCVDYTGSSDYGGEMNMMLGVSPEGKVTGVQIISHAETFLDRYTDQNGCYTGVDVPRGEDLSAGATLSYNAIRNAIEAVEAVMGGDK